jgi:hypothetical protein
MPMKPVTPERTAPMMKPTAGHRPRNQPTSAATTTPTMAIAEYCRAR